MLPRHPAAAREVGARSAAAPVGPRKRGPPPGPEGPEDGSRPVGEVMPPLDGRACGACRPAGCVRVQRTSEERARMYTNATSVPVPRNPDRSRSPLILPARGRARQTQAGPQSQVGRWVRGPTGARPGPRRTEGSTGPSGTRRRRRERAPAGRGPAPGARPGPGPGPPDPARQGARQPIRDPGRGRTADCAARTPPPARLRRPGRRSGHPGARARPRRRAGSGRGHGSGPGGRGRRGRSPTAAGRGSAAGFGVLPNSQMTQPIRRVAVCHRIPELPGTVLRMTPISSPAS